MKTNEKKNTSAKKKLIPAVAMLTTSAVMLSTATYAWFTMSREVEVTGIKLTATTPQTIEISLGRATTQATIDNTTWATAPKNDAADTDLWSNKAATSSVYASFGKLIPASSTDGTNLYYTTKAKENGKSVDITGANAFTQATENNNAGWTFQTAGASSETESNLTADTKGEGYYLDIPVWFRTTNVEDVKLGVDVTVTDPNADDDNAKGDLYKATRVAFLTSDKTTANGVFLGAETDVDNGYYKKKAVRANTGTSENDYYGTVTVAKEVTANTAGQVTNSDSTEVANVTGVGTGKTGYSTPAKYYIRVWLEGEDVNCWNVNAGQSFNVDLKFYDLSNKGVAD
jgi:hypothetical protein